MVSLNEWKKSIIHLYCKNHKRDESNEKEGTGIIVKYNEFFYLVTSRHLIFDQNNNSIYDLVIRIPTYDEQITKESLLTGFCDNSGNVFVGDSKPNFECQEVKFSEPNFLTCLNAGPSDINAYTVSSEYDIAVISLNRDLTGFYQLIKDNYRPVTMDDISDEPSSEGSDIFSIGYPRMSIILECSDLPEAILHWSSAKRTLPIFTFGKVAMLHPDLHYFWGDVRVYHGNSGGPIIEDNKIVGIVSQTGVEMDEDELIRLPFAKAIKMKYVNKIIFQQVKKDIEFFKRNA